MATQEAVMTTQDIANRLYELCKASQFQQAQEELYADDAVSIEPVGATGPQSVKGLDEIFKKGEEFRNSIEEVHGGDTTASIVVGNNFALGITIVATFKGMGRM